MSSYILSNSDAGIDAGIDALYINHLERCIEKAENNISNINDFILNMDGMSGVKTRHFYNNLLSLEDSRYLEIGTWKGSSVCSAMFTNNATVLCIDTWEGFGGPFEEFKRNFNECKGNNNASFIKADCYTVDVSAIGKFNMYMFDGEHDYDSHYNSLVYYKDCLDDIFIFIVDDWNIDTVRIATNASIKDLNFKILWEKEIRLTNDNSHTPQPTAKETWWNGIYICVLQKI